MEPIQPAPADRRIRVLVVDADRRVRQSLCGLIDLADDMVIAGAAGDPAGALAGLAETPVDLVLLDPRLPEFEAGRALVRAISHGWPGTPIVALYWPDEPGGDPPAASLTVMPASVQPDSLVDLLRASAPGADLAAAGGLSWTGGSPGGRPS